MQLTFTGVRRLSSIIILVLSISVVSGGSANSDWEYFFMTKDTDGEEVVIRITNSNSPRWDEHKKVATGTEMAEIFHTDDLMGCSNSFAFDQGGLYETPSIGYTLHLVTVEVDGKDAYFILKQQDRLATIRINGSPMIMMTMNFI